MGRRETEAETASLPPFCGRAFRLECRDAYDLTYEEADFRRFLAGEPVPPPDVAWWRPWLDDITRLTAQGKTVRRVRVLAEPPSDYQRWELWAAPWHAAAGEQIRYITRSRAAAIGLPLDEDWWLYDDDRLVIMRFDDDGKLTGSQEVTGHPVARYCSLRDLAVRASDPATVTAG